MKGVIIRYENDLKYRLCESTRKTYLREAKRFVEYAKKRKITRKLTQMYKEEMRGRYKATTLNLYLTALNSYLDFIGRRDCRVQLCRLQKKKSVENVISSEEFDRMLSYACRNKMRKAYCIMCTLVTTGIRIGELKYITVDILEKGATEVCNKGKYREIYLPDRLAEELRKYCRENEIRDGNIFLGNRGTPISRAGVWYMLQNIAEECQVPKEKAHPHSFRHFFAKAYITQYGNLSELADILGHSSIEITRIYTRTSVNEKRERLEHLNYFKIS